MTRISNSFPRIPAKALNGTRMKFYHIDRFGLAEEITAAQFHNLAMDASDPCAHILPDLQQGPTYFMDSMSPEQAEFNRNACRALEREKKQIHRESGCMFSGTTRCNGWKPDENGRYLCDSCAHCIQRTVSGDTSTGADDDPDTSIWDTISDTNTLSPDETLIRQETRELYLKALSSLSPVEQRFLRDAQRAEDGEMTFNKLASMYGLQDQRSAHKKMKRIEEKIIRDCQSFS